MSAPASASTAIGEAISSVYPHASEASISELTRTAHEVRLAARDILVGQGDAMVAGVVADGFMISRRTTPEGRQLAVRILRAGSAFGFFAVAGLPAPADLVAVTDVGAFTWSGTTLRDLVARDPGVGVDVIDAMSTVVLEIIQRLDEVVHQDARRRVAHILERYGDLFFGRPPVVPRAYLAAVVGTTREMTDRVLRSLERQRILRRVGRDALELLSPAGLRQILAPDG